MSSTSNFPPETEYQIDRFLRREMDDKELQRFKRRIEEEPALVEEILLRKDIILGIRAAEHKSLRELMERADPEGTQLSESREESPASFRRYLFIMLAVLVLLGLFFVLLRVVGVLEPTQLR